MILTRIFITSFFIFLFTAIIGNIFFGEYYRGEIIGFSYIILLVGTILFFWREKVWFEMILLFGISIAIGAILLYPVKDVSYDGSTYHLEIIQNFIAGRSFLSRDTIDLWSHVYPKNQELLLSIFASFTPGYIDFGRIFKVLLIGISIVAVYDFSSIRFPRFRWYGYVFILFGILLHPLIIAQTMTKYIDDMLYLFFVLFVLAILSREYLIALMISAILIGSKLNYILYGIITFPILFFLSQHLAGETFSSWYHRSQKWYRQKISASYLTVILMGSIVGGYIYGINTYHFQNPFFPLLGSSSVEVVANNLPINLQSVSKVTAHLYSFFGYSLSDIQTPAVLLDPRDPHLIDVIIQSYAAIEVDTRIAGFGTIWGILFALSLFVSIVLLLFHPKRWFLVVIFLTLLMILTLMPFAWARFIPFFYLFPFFLSLFLPRFIRWIYVPIILGGLVWNTSLYATSYFGRYYVHNGVQNLITAEYIREHSLHIIGYFPGIQSNVMKKRASDTTQNEVYHLPYTIPLMKKEEIGQYCDIEKQAALFYLPFSIITPRLLDCENGYFLIHTRGYLFQDFLIARQMEK